MTTEPAGPAAWQPVHVTDTAELERLVADPSVDVIDTLDRQRAELGKILPAPDPYLLTEPSRWFYYPWRRSVVHLLGPRAFQTLRSDRNRNKLTVEEQQQLRKLTVGVVGLSVGHAIAYTVALEGACGQIRLADFDEIELSNLNRIPGSVFDLGLNKAVVAARRITEVDPYVDVRVETAGLTVETTDRFMAGLDVVVEECDSLDVKVALREAARRHRIPVLMETSDRGLLDVERFDLEPDRPLFHGLLGDVETAELAGMATRDKVPYVLRILEPDQLSARVVASMTEIDETVSTWPQLGGDIHLGAATVATAVRHLGLGLPLRSGRVRVDLTQQLGQISEPPAPELTDLGTAGTEPEAAPADARAGVVHAARLAPSGGNTQPWRFVARDSSLEIHLDPAQTSTLDVGFRGSYVAIGASLFNARVAAAHHGILGADRVFPHGRDEGPVATLELRDGEDAELAAMYDAMLRRVSNRHLTVPRPLPDGTEAALGNAAKAEGAQAHVVTDRVRLDRLARLFGESDRLRFLTPHLHEEMMRELRWPGRDTLDWGLDVRTMEMDSSDLAKLRVAQRSDVMRLLAEHDLGNALGQPSRDRVAGASALVVITTETADPAEYVRGGQAVERAWITAEQLGLSVQVMSPVFIYAVDPGDYEELSPTYADRLIGLRSEFDELAGTDGLCIALAMRIGYAPLVSARSHRLPAERTVRIV